ncbi:MAG TPA: multicopper oxidase domain-containing protein [Solirubrobacterales bacterium]|jgi:FtsP/CotA-like multicopper oxidase with cupredoxin domain|nr:multicopper oxidase domain-containing protein [Solirubrobacterales bacterium]HMY25006.1 multicopper oxidase domain-containing protein [Solirubrobacterales bacterium]HNA23325.1 multicopper oxidase domain-containing protein [Solirubrobacterales bacterium]HNA43564.1 multicopper oxidase domain-containing protein [Solirubrobacterales bacterium]HNC14400.1 multicopper oxidase domain-containing protein [Solirubrobacterales bacterium]
MDRRNFLGLAGGAFLCTIAGKQYSIDSNTDLAALANKIEVPPKVAAAKRSNSVSNADISGNRKEYWIQAEPVTWNVVPKQRDQMMGTSIKKTVGRTKVPAYAYRLYDTDFSKPLGPATVPGPLLDVTVGDTLVVNFRNACDVPVTMHPHGVFYSNEMDGAYKGYWTDPGGFVQKGRTFQYVWECPEGTQGSWLYHDHGPFDSTAVFKGLFGPLIVRDPDEPLPDREYFLGFHSYLPGLFPLKAPLFAINGRAYAGNTPTMRATVGDDVAMHVYGVDNDMHTFHVHGHRWQEAGGTYADNKIFGPGDSFRVRWIEQNPGRWLYHCHVFSHLVTGMSGWYIVD